MKRIKYFRKNIVDVYLQGMPLYPAKETQTIFLEQEMKKVKKIFENMINGKKFTGEYFS